MTLTELYGLDHAGLVRFIKSEYGLAGDKKQGNPHRIRREEIARRLRLYRDDGQVDFEHLVRRIFKNVEVQTQRIEMIEVASEQNVTGRITDEVASLYDKPALRLFAEQVNDKFKEEEDRINLHEIMQDAHRLTFLCNEVLIWQFRGIDDKTKLRVVTSDTFDAIPDPRDKTVEAGIIIDTAPVVVREGGDKNALPHYEMWDDTYRYLLNANGDLVDANGTPAAEPIAHGLTRIPGVIFHRREPNDRILDARAGRDIVAAHFGVGLLNIMIMRLAKSQGERQPILQGNLASVAAGQPMDGERPIPLPPEVEAKMLDSVTKPDHYLEAKKDKLASIGQRYGLSYEQMTYTETAGEMGSGKAYTIRREKLSELRGEQLRRALRHEYLVVTLMGFDAKQLTVDHQEQTLPQDANEEVDLLAKKLRMGLDSQVGYLMRKDPSLSRPEAIKKFKDNISDWTLLVDILRSMNMPADSTAIAKVTEQDVGIESSKPNVGNSPQVNGANNNPASGATTQNHPATGQATAAKAGGKP